MTGLDDVERVERDGTFASTARWGVAAQPDQLIGCSMTRKTSILYRENEASELRYAREATLEHIRAMHERSARHWGDLAARLEKLEM